MSSRNYQSGTEKALFLLSRGRCYKPSCQELVLRLVDGELIPNVHIAHIKGLNKTSPRHDARLSEKELNSFTNLILLCTPHHKLIDGKTTWHKYPETLLRKWKAEREGELAVALQGLEGVTESRLRDWIVGAVTATRGTLDTAINQLALISEDMAEVLRTVTSETFNRPYLDLDAVASLEESARIFINLPDSASLLYDAAHRFHEVALAENLPSHADLRRLEAVAAQRLPDQFRELEQLTDQLRDLLRDLPRIEQSSIQLMAAAAEYDEAHPVITIDHPSKWLYFRSGLLIGALVVGLMWWLIATGRV